MNDSDSRARPPHPAPLCARYQPLLALLRTGALSPREAAKLTQHLSDCPWCQRELATYDTLDAAARQHLSTVPFTPLTLEDIMQTPQTHIQPPDANATPTPTHGEEHPTSSHQPSQRPPISALASLAAVMALILLAGLIFTTHGLGVPIGSGTPMPTIPTATLPTVSQPSAALAQSTWTLTQFVVDRHEHPLVPSHAPTLRFRPHDDRSGDVLGNSGCNGYSGSYTLAGTSLHMSGFGSLQLECGLSGIMDQENAYLQALPRVAQFHLEGDTLILSSTDGSVRLTFHGTRDAALTQTTWTLTDLVVDGHEQPLVPSHAPTLHLQPQDSRGGAIDGTGGCNGYNGSYTLVGTTLHMSVSMVSLMGCQSILSTPENAYLQALPRVAHFHLEGDTLTLTSADGSVQLTFHGIRDVALTQTTWTLTRFDVNAHERPIVPSHVPTLRFQSQDNQGGVIQGKGGCNGYSGSYTLTDGTLHMSLSGTTNMLCTRDVMDEEHAYLDALPDIKLFHLEGDTLTMSSGDGSVQLTFHA